MIAGTREKSPEMRNALRSERPHHCAVPDPAEIALQLTGRSYISHSAMSTYQTCPLRYYFTYVAKLPKESVSASLVFGGAIHRALEAHSHAIMVGETPPSPDDLMAAYERAWKAKANTRVRFGRSDSEASLRDLAHRMLPAA